MRFNPPSSSGNDPETVARLSRVDAPASLVLFEAERFNATVGHENRGFLSWSHGFIPIQAPLNRLNRDFEAWDQIALELPLLHASLELRSRVQDLPILDASEQSLEASEVLRACSLLAILAHAYWNVECKPPDSLPPSIQLPWQQLRARLGRSQEVLSYIDLIVYNWKLVDADDPDPMRVENLELLIPTVGTREEQIFYLTQLEILARSSGIVRAATLAQSAVLRNDDRALERALVDVAIGLERLVAESLLKINPNPHAKNYVDPVVWAKTVAPLAVPLHAGDEGPSGTSSPIFNALDIFFERKRHASFLGREITRLRAHYPPFWRSFLEALSQVSVVRYVEQSGNRSLHGALREALELYAGESGFLGRHRMKVYGYLELAFKVGRSVTIGGFCGAFQDRTWDQVDSELVASRQERLVHCSEAYQEATVEAVTPGPEQGPHGVRRVALDVSSAGARYRTGDRCAVLPENGSALVDRTLRALHATGDELLPLTDEWKQAARLRLSLAERTLLSTREILRFGCIRPVTPRVAEALHAETQDPELLEQIQLGTTERWELWELLEVVAQQGLDTKGLWRAPDGTLDDRLSRLIPPERFRVYSISGVARATPDAPLRALELTVGQLTYEAEPPPSSKARGCPVGGPGGESRVREGTASSFLSRAKQTNRPVPFRIERPARFRLPLDPSTPILLFAAGTGMAPYRAFIQERARTPSAGLCWLFLSLRTPSEFLLGAELKAPAASGSLRFDAAFTRTGAALKFDPDSGFFTVPGPTRRIENLILEEATAHELWRLLQPKDAGGPGASIYICGRSSFAATVMSTLGLVFQRFGTAAGSLRKREADRFLHQLSGDGRLVLELHTDAKPILDESRWIDVSEVAEHNGEEAGYWMIIEQLVYDLTEFAELHPGGKRIVQTYAGMDASHGFARAHDRQPDVDAMREMYRIGRIRALELEAFTAKVIKPTGAELVDCRAAYKAWVRALHVVAEMQNALSADLSLQQCAITLGEDPTSRGPYKLSRAAEAHLRFLRSCLKPLLAETLPSLWSICQALFAPNESASWMSERLRHVSQSQRTRYVKAMSRSLVDDFPRWLERESQLIGVIDAVREDDPRLLQDLKQVLITGVRIFEKLEVETRQRGADSLISACRRTVQLVDEYYERLNQRIRHICEGPPMAGRTSSQWPAANIRRLHDSEYWVLEEFPEQHIAVLHRTPVPAPSLSVLAQDNEVLLSSLREEHRNFGLVVDARQAPLRNDKDFEHTMAKLRSELSSRFQRAAVLLDSPVAELQATRLERDEGRNTLVTRSVSAAFRFAAGGR